FQTRCRWKKFVPGNKCETELPPFRDLGNGHRSLCWLDDEQLAKQKPVIRFEAKADDAARPPTGAGARVTKAPVAKKGKKAEVASETADPVSPAKEPNGAGASRSREPRPTASAVPGSSAPEATAGKVGSGRQAVSMHTAPGETESRAAAKKASGTKETAAAKANKAGSRATGKGR